MFIFWKQTFLFWAKPVSFRFENCSKALIKIHDCFKSITRRFLLKAPETSSKKYFSNSQSYLLVVWAFYAWVITLSHHILFGWLKKLSIELIRQSSCRLTKNAQKSLKTDQNCTQVCWKLGNSITKHYSYILMQLNFIAHESDRFSLVGNKLFDTKTIFRQKPKIPLTIESSTKLECNFRMGIIYDRDFIARGWNLTPNLCGKALSEIVQ